MIIYCQRDKNNAISGLFAAAQYMGQEQIDDGDAAAVAFKSTQPAPNSASIVSRIAALEAKVAAISAIPSIAAIL